jgi:CRISPR-associated protein Cas5t
LYQQLHAYPVGNSSKELAAKTHGAKYHIAPVRREILSGFDVVIGLEGDPKVVDRVRAGLRGELEGHRYGLPFAGDNNLLFDRIDLMDDPIASLWYTPVDAQAPARRGSCRLTVDIDRADNSRTRSVLVAPLSNPQRMPPADAWVWTPRQPVGHQT